jgi:hypothetical protein
MPDAAEIRVRAGPQSRTPRPQEGARRARGTERANSPAQRYGALRGTPEEVGVEETVCGLQPWRKLPPKLIKIKLKNGTGLKTGLKQKIRPVAPLNTVKLSSDFKSLKWWTHLGSNQGPAD